MTSVLAEFETSRGMRGRSGSDTVSASLAVLPEIDLAELARHAALLKRTDRKYVVSSEIAAALVDHLGQAGARSLAIGGRREFAYLSDYFDTPDFALYRAAATKRRRRFKVRSRVYLDSGMQFVELKTRSGRGQNVKDRLRLENLPPEACENLKAGTPDRWRDLLTRPAVAEWLATRLAERHIAQTRREGARIAAGLSGVNRSVYTRATLHLPGDSRMTLDENLVLSSLSKTGNATAVDASSAAPQQYCVPGVVVETKSNGHPCKADRWLWSRGVRPVRLSKYAVGVATANPDLPANRWHKTMTQLGDMR